MKKFTSILLRIIFAVVVSVSGFLLIQSPVTVNVPNVHSMAKVIIKKNVDKTNDLRLKGTLQLAKELGVEDKILDQLPRQYHYDLSYMKMYQLGVSYQENGELTAKNLSLPEKNQVQKAVSNLILDKINKSLDKDSIDVKQKINIYQYFLYALVLVFVLAALLILFGKYWASVLLLIASVGTYGVLQFYANNLLQYLQTELYKGVTLTISSGLWLGLGLGIIVVILWPLALKLTKKQKTKTN